MPWLIDPDTGEERFFEEGHPDVERIEGKPKGISPWLLIGAAALGAVAFFGMKGGRNGKR